MPVICLSISHHTAPVELRECMSLSPEKLEELLTGFRDKDRDFASITELVALSTCNRLEFYAQVENSGENAETVFQPLLNYMRDQLSLSPGLWMPYLRQYSGSQVVEHLFQVAAGLDSIAMGETQILGQVEQAYETALRLHGAGHVLSSLFQAAIHAGKRVRTETEIGRHPTSISALAVQLAEVTLDQLPQRNILVVGAGKMGGLTIEALQARGVRQIYLTSRTASHATQMAEKFGVATLPYAGIAGWFTQADVIFTSLASPAPVISRELIAEAMDRRNQEPITLIDLAVPRNVDPRVKEIDQVHVFDMDDLQAFAKFSSANSDQGLARAEAIVSEEAAGYEKLMRITPFIGELHKKAERIRQQEVKRAMRGLRQNDPAVNQQMEILSRSLVKKILHEPTMRLRKEADEEELLQYVGTLSKLFDIHQNGSEQFDDESAGWEI
jgi:glutamyl-tRNA reductase